MDIDSAASTPILRMAARSVERAVPALRAHGARLPPRSRPAPGGAGLHRARDRPGRRTRPGLGARLRRAPRRRRRDQPDHRQRGHARPVQRVLRRHLHPPARAHRRRRRPELRPPQPERYDVIQASLVDTWAATAAGAYTLTENTLYTVEAFDDYLDHLTDEGVLTITRWVFDGLRLVSLAQAACEQRGWDAGPARDRPARPRRDVPVQEDAVHARRDRARSTPSPRSSGFRDAVLRQASPGRSATAAMKTASTALRPATTRGSIARRRSRGVLRGASRRTSGRPPTIVRSSSTPRSWRTSSPWPSADRCCSATG